MIASQDLIKFLKTKMIDMPLLQHGVINSLLEFESPCVVQAKIHIDTDLRVGSFTGIYGGRLRHTEVGRYCSIADGLQTGWDEHPIDRLTSSMIGYVPNVHGWGEAFGVDMDHFRKHAAPFKPRHGMTEIGNDVWIGHGVFIKSGVKIGHGCVVAAGSVVLKDVPPYHIVGGVPARTIRLRHNEKIIERCLKLQWWMYNILQMLVEYISNASQFLDVLEEQINNGVSQFKSPYVFSSNTYTEEKIL